MDVSSWLLHRRAGCGRADVRLVFYRLRLDVCNNVLAQWAYEGTLTSPFDSLGYPRWMSPSEFTGQARLAPYYQRTLLAEHQDRTGQPGPGGSPMPAAHSCA